MNVGELRSLLTDVADDVEVTVSFDGSSIGNLHIYGQVTKVALEGSRTGKDLAFVISAKGEE